MRKEAFMKAQNSLQEQIRTLVQEAEQATDTAGNGLLDRGDFCDLVRRLLSVTRILLEENEAVTRERDELENRLMRLPQQDEPLVRCGLMHRLVEIHAPA